MPAVATGSLTRLSQSSTSCTGRDSGATTSTLAGAAALAPAGAVSISFCTVCKVLSAPSHALGFDAATRSAWSLSRIVLR